MNDGASHRNIEWLARKAAPTNGQRHLGIRWPAHFIHGIRERHAGNQLAVNVGDEIGGLYSGLGSRRIVHRCDNLDDAVFHRHFHTKAAEFAPGLSLHLLKTFLVHVAGMRIEGRQHSIQRSFDQLFVCDRIDVIGAHAFQHIRKQRQLLEGIGTICGFMDLGSRAGVVGASDWLSGTSAGRRRLGQNRSGGKQGDD